MRKEQQNERERATFSLGITFLDLKCILWVEWLGLLLSVCLRRAAFSSFLTEMCSHVQYRCAAHRCAAQKSPGFPLICCFSITRSNVHCNVFHCVFRCKLLFTAGAKQTVERGLLHLEYDPVFSSSFY